MQMRRDAALLVVSLQYFQQVQHDPRAGSADRMAEGDCAAVHVELFFIQGTQSPIEAELFAAVLLVLPRREAAEHLRGEGLVDLPVVEVVQAEVVALEDRRRRVHRAEAHLRRDRGRPIAESTMRPMGFRSCFFTASSEARTSHAAPSVICELLPGVTLPYLRSKNGFSLARFGGEASRAHAVVER